MSELIIKAAFFGLPMISVMLLYRLFDRSGERTEKLSRRMTFISRHKTAFQLGVPVGIITVFGAAAVICGISINVYMTVCGVLIGLINGMATRLCTRTEYYPL